MVRGAVVAESEKRDERTDGAFEDGIGPGIWRTKGKSEKAWRRGGDQIVVSDVPDAGSRAGNCDCSGISVGADMKAGPVMSEVEECKLRDVKWGMWRGVMLIEGREEV